MYLSVHTYTCSFKDLPSRSFTIIKNSKPPILKHKNDDNLKRYNKIETLQVSETVNLYLLFSFT